MLEYTRAGVERQLPLLRLRDLSRVRLELRLHPTTRTSPSPSTPSANIPSPAPSRPWRFPPRLAPVDWPRGVRRGRHGAALPQGYQGEARPGSHDPLWLRAPAHDRDAHCGIRQRKRPKRAVRFSRAARFHNDQFSALKAIEQGDSFTSASKAIGRSQSAHFMQKAAPSAGSPVGRGGDSIRFQSVAQSQTLVSESMPAMLTRMNSAAEVGMFLPTKSARMGSSRWPRSMSTAS